MFIVDSFCCLSFVLMFTLGYSSCYIRRVVPTGAQDIGTWLVILQMTAIIAVITNAGIMCFTMELIPFTAWGEVWLFIGFQYVIFVAMAVFSYIVDDVPEDVAIQLQRQEYLRERAEMSDEERQEENIKGKTGSRPVQTNIPESLLSVR
jgi:hypothetical protein